MFRLFLAVSGLWQNVCYEVVKYTRKKCLGSAKTTECGFKTLGANFHRWCHKYSLYDITQECVLTYDKVNVWILLHTLVPTNYYFFYTTTIIQCCRCVSKESCLFTFNVRCLQNWCLAWPTCRVKRMSRLI